MKTKQMTMLWALAGMLWAAGCTNDDENTVDPSPQAGYVSGQVTDTQGKPMAGVKVIVDNTLFYNTNIVTTTNADGRYRVQVPNGSWRVTAETERTYNGQTYRIDLHPDVYEDFAGSDGAVRNFQWKLTGQKPYIADAFYGGSIELRYDPQGEMYDPENIEFTLKPVGSLIDGSAGNTLVLRCSSHAQLNDIPIGRYSVTAVHKPTGKALRLRNVDSNSYEHFSSITVDFFGKTSPRFCTNCLVLEYTAL